MQTLPSSQQTRLLQRLTQLSRSGQVRLDREECAALAYALSQETAVTIVLFGSRTQADRRGGDIDLLILGKVPSFETSQRIATRFFSRCEEKIDVIVIDPETATPAQQAFLNQIQTITIS